MHRLIGHLILLSAVLLSGCADVWVQAHRGSGQGFNPETSFHTPLKPEIDPWAHVLLTTLEGSTTKTGTPSPCDAKGRASVDITQQKQKTSAWCWAATAQIVMDVHLAKERYQESTTQCDAVSRVFRDGLTDVPMRTCCNMPLHSACYRAWWPDAVFDAYGFDYRWIQTPNVIMWEGLAAEICQGRPFIYVVEDNEGGRHAYVVTGYQFITDAINKTAQIVEIFDPLDSHYDFRTYEEFAEDIAREEKHYRTYVAIAPFP